MAFAVELWTWFGLTYPSQIKITVWNVNVNLKTLEVVNPAFS